MWIPIKYRINSATFNGLFKVLALLFILFSLSQCRQYRKSNPRGKFFHGYIVFSSTDSLEGSIKVKAAYDSKVTIIPDGLKKRVHFPVEDIERMRINLIRYGKISVDGKPRLLEKVAYGEYNLYAFNQMVKDQVKIFYFFEIEPGETLTLTRDNYNSILEDYLTGVPEIEDKLYYDKVAFTDVIELVRSYNRKIIKN